MVLSDSQLLEAVAARMDVAQDVVRFVHAHPELGHAEHDCAEYLVSTLRSGGLDVEQGVADMPTAFRATVRGARPGRHVGIVAVYDAVPAVLADTTMQPVHSCGHGPLAGGVVAAALALAGLRDRMAGRVTVFGCPADEIHAPGTVARGGGKALSAAAGLWDDVDAALYAHPEFIDTVTLASLWMRRDRATVGGRRTLREGASPPPAAALAAVARVIDSQPRDRVMLERLVFDGDVEEGSGLALEATFLLFADDERGIDAAAAPLRDALPDARWDAGPVVAGVRPDPEVTATVAAAFSATGRAFVADPPPLPFATDFGNISRRAPAALIGVGRPGGWRFHTEQGVPEFDGPDGLAVGQGIAEVLALSAARLTEPA
jgi:metal-dependent amidase/aminoacylase/carboxypeptidase family protein